MNIDDQQACLKLRNHISALSKMSDKDWELLQHFLEVKNISKNELFIREGKRVNEVGIVLQGMFRQFYTQDERKKIFE